MSPAGEINRRGFREKVRVETKKIIWLLLALGNLFLAACGAGRVPWWKLGSPGLWIQHYGVFSGTSSTFAFFAPDVGTSMRAQFDLYDERGQFLSTDSLQKGPTREADLRITNIVEFIVNDLEDEQSRHLLSASWAGKIFARHPEAAFAVLRVQSYDIPTMNRYRNGVRYHWQTLYRAKFARERKAGHDYVSR